MARKTGSRNTGYALEEVKQTSGKARWRVRIWKDDPDTGEKTRYTIKNPADGRTSFATRTEANKAGREAAHQKDRGTFLNPSTATVGDVLDIWHSFKTSEGVTANSLRDFESVIRRYIKPALGTVPVQSLTTLKVEHTYDNWRDGQFEDVAPLNPDRPGRQRAGKGLSPSLRTRCHMVLSQALDYAVRKGLVYRNVAKEAKKPRAVRPVLNVWNPDEVRRFLNLSVNRPVTFRQSAKPGVEPKDFGTRPDELTPIWHLLALEGLRRGEALGLRWKDFNEDRGTIHISQTVVADKSNRGAAVVQSRTKTKTGARTVKLTPDTFDLLQARQTERTDRARFAGVTLNGNDLIVCTATGGPVNPSNVSRSFERLVKLAGLPRIRVHDLRHSAATMLLRAGIPAKIVSERLGHAKVSITLDTYSHVLPDMQGDAADAMSRIVNLKTAI